MSFYNVHDAWYRLQWVKCVMRANASTRVWESMGEQERGRVKSNNVILRVRDEVQGLGTSSEPQWDSETRGEVLPVFLVCTGEYIYNVKFLNEKLTTNKFYCSHKGPEMCTKVQHPKLLYPAHNTCSAVMWPLWYVWSARPTQCQSNPADTSSQLLCANVLMCHIQIVKLPGVLCSTELGIAMCMRCQPKAKIIRNC